MKRTILLLGAGVLAATMAFAQDSPSATSGAQDNSGQTRTESSSRSTSVIRGCLSGSSGNYTVTDANGMQYEVSGDDGTLRSMVGREVEITVSEDRSTQDSSQGSGTTTHSTNTVQASDVRAVSSSCKLGSTAPQGSAGDHANPKGTPDAATPKLMAMLQEPSKQSTSTDPNQASPPVTSQTPAGQSSPTNSQAGSSPANNAGMTESEANHDAQAARQGELSTNPQTGETTGRGVDNQGVNNPSTTNPNAVPTSPNSAAPSNAQQPQSNANDQNKPLYERQASDIPWANSSGGNTGTPNPPH